MNSELLHVLTVLLWCAAIPCTAFPFVYGLTAKWWSSYMGRSLMATKSSLAFALDLTIYFQYHHLGLTSQLRLAIFIYASIALALWFQLISYLVLWRQTRRQEQTKRNKEDTDDPPA